MTDLAALQATLREAGQAHLCARLEGLAPPRRKLLARALEAIDYELVSELADLARTGSTPAVKTATPDLEPPALVPLRKEGRVAQDAERATEHGRGLLASGKVGYVLVAGGQGSRLGLDGPKGKFRVGPISGLSLFAYHARRLRKASDGGRVSVPWYIMTSPANDAETRAFFEDHGHFGLVPEDVFFFPQAMLPALDPDGRILLAAEDTPFLAPNGHGGLLTGLRSSGALDDMRARGLEHLSYFQVDNPLVRPADPLFLGLHARAEAGMSSKVVAKRDASEKVGVIGRIDGKLGCIEYSDLSDELRHAKDDRGELRFRAGNIAVHALSVDFLDDVTRGNLRLPWHVAKKAMKVVDENGRQVERTGYKFETFVFDALALSEESVTLEVERAHEFSPVKNASGEDSPETARRDLLTLHAGWLAAAGADLPAADAFGLHPVEVDPLFAETGEEFAQRMPATPVIRDEGHHYDDP